MPAPLNGYSLTSQFRKIRARYAFTSLEADLFYELVAVCNDGDWVSEFSISNTLLCAVLGCSERALIAARARLAGAGLLAYVSGTRRTPTAYRLGAANGLPTVSHAPANGLPQGLPEDLPTVNHSGNGLPEGLPQGLPTVSPYKEQTKLNSFSPEVGVFSGSDSEADPAPTPDPLHPSTPSGKPTPKRKNGPAASASGTPSRWPTAAPLWPGFRPT